MKQPAWYKPVDRALEASWPMMLVVAGAIIIITIALIAARKKLLLAGWLTYLLMP